MIWVFSPSPPPSPIHKYITVRTRENLLPRTLCMTTGLGRVWSAQCDRGKATQRSLELSQMPALPLNLVIEVSIAPASGLIALSGNWKRCSRSSMSNSWPNEVCDPLAANLTYLYGSRACLRTCYTQAKLPRVVLGKHPKNLPQST